VQYSRTLVTSVAVLVAVPICVELLISYIKSEPYSLVRSGAVLAGVAAVLVIVVALRSLARQLRLLLEFSLLVFGFVTTVAGVYTIVSEPRDIDVVGMTVCGLGLLITALAGYSIYVDRSGAEFYFATVETAMSRTSQRFADGGHEVLLTTFPSYQPNDNEVAELCRAATDTGDLHFAGYYVDGRCRFSVDVLDDDALNRFFRGSDRTIRRAVYERAGRQLSWTMARLNSYLRRMDGGILIRTVLDVEQGALYYYWIDKNVYLTGVTMDQSKVLDTDDKLRRLANAIGYLPHGGTLGLPLGPRIPQVVQEDG